MNRIDKSKALFPAAITALMLMLAGCGESEPSRHGEGHAAAAGQTVKDHAMQHAAGGYVCPMHPEVRSDEPGNCPVCGMHLVEAGEAGEQAAETVKEHAMKHAAGGYVCPMHPEVRSDEPGNCPVCGMHLVAAGEESGAATGHGDAHAGAAQDVKDHALMHAAGGYTCPMHPQVQSDEPGNCPVCGMHLVAAEPGQEARQ